MLIPVRSIDNDAKVLIKELDGNNIFEYSLHDCFICLTVWQYWFKIAFRMALTSRHEKIS